MLIAERSTSKSTFGSTEPKFERKALSRKNMEWEDLYDRMERGH